MAASNRRKTERPDRGGGAAPYVRRTAPYVRGSATGRRRWAVLAVLLGSLIPAVAPGPATAAPSPVRIRVATTGTVAPTYRIEVHNGSATELDSTVRQELPEGLAPTSVSDGGQVTNPAGQSRGLEVSWRLRLAPGGTGALETTLSPPPASVDLTAPACVFPGGGGAGALAYDCATAAWTSPQPVVEAAPPWWQRTWAIAAGLGVLVLLVLAAVAWRWRVRRRRAAARAAAGAARAASTVATVEAARAAAADAARSATTPGAGDPASSTTTASSAPGAPGLPGPRTAVPTGDAGVPTGDAGVPTGDAGVPAGDAGSRPPAGRTPRRPSRGGGGVYQGGRPGGPKLVGDEPPATQPGGGSAGGPIWTPRPMEGPWPGPGPRRRRVGPPLGLLVGLAAAVLTAALTAVTWGATDRVAAVSNDRQPSSGAWVGETTTGPVGATLRDSAFEFTVYRVVCPTGTGRCEATVGLHNVSGHDQPWHGELQRAYLPGGEWVSVNETATLAANAGRDLFAEPVPAGQRHLVPLVFTVPGADPPTRIELRGEVFSAGVSVNVP